MFSETLATEIALAPAYHLDYLERLLWQAHASGALTGDEAQELAEQLADRQREPGPELGNTLQPSAWLVIAEPRRHDRLLFPVRPDVNAPAASPGADHVIQPQLAHVAEPHRRAG
jgi:hypothetical protein